MPSPTNQSNSIRAATIDINSVNLNINELYKQYAKKPSSSIANNFNNTTQVQFYSSKPPTSSGNYRAISVLDSSQLNPLLNTT